jgi:hypothetical protein
MRWRSRLLFGFSTACRPIGSNLECYATMYEIFSCISVEARRSAPHRDLSQSKGVSLGKL